MGWLSCIHFDRYFPDRWALRGKLSRMVVVVGRAPAKNARVWQGHCELMVIDLSAYTKYRMEKL
jgi:hypothetical protein